MTKSHVTVPQPQVSNFVDLMQEYEIKIPDIQAASYATMDSDFSALRDAMWSGECG